VGAIRIQKVGAQGNAATHVIDSADGWLTPGVGSLLVAWANSDATVTVNNSMTAGPSVVDGNGVYFWYKVAAGTESSFTFTPAVSAKHNVGVLEYTGLAPSSPFDVSNTSTIASSPGNTTGPVSVTTTDVDGSLILALAGLHSIFSFTPSSPVWTNSFVNIDHQTNGAFSGTDCVSFLGELITGSNALVTTGCSWTGASSAGDRQQLVIAFDAEAVIAGDVVGEPLVIAPTRGTGR
jgi:hypothetical protein